VEQVAQVGTRLRLTGVWPEEEGKLLARLGGVAVDGQVGQQRLLALAANTCNRDAVVDEVEITQQLNV
jgi:hypothetical protein